LKLGIDAQDVAAWRQTGERHHGIEDTLLPIT
jgi:hypothetical protein